MRVIQVITMARASAPAPAPAPAPPRMSPWPPLAWVKAWIEASCVNTVPRLLPLFKWRSNRPVGGTESWSSVVGPVSYALPPTLSVPLGFLAPRSWVQLLISRRRFDGLVRSRRTIACR